MTHRRPQFTARELKRIYAALFFAHRDRITSVQSLPDVGVVLEKDMADLKKMNAQSIRDAAAFARLRLKVERMLK